MTEEFKECLDMIRPKVSKKHTDLDKRELDALNIVSMHIRRHILKERRVLPIDVSCSSCILSEVNRVYNYITFHEVRDVAEVPVKPKRPRKKR